MQRRAAAVTLPANVMRIRGRNGKHYYYFQERRGQKDAGKRFRLPGDPHDPVFWAKVQELSLGYSGPKPGSFDALIAHYRSLSSYRNLARNTQNTYGIALGHISAALGAQEVRGFQARHLYALQEAHADRPSMANMIVRVMSVLLREGVRADYCASNVARDVKQLRENPDGAAPWSEAVFSYVLRNAPERLMRAAVLGRATGQRAVDLVRMRGADLNDQGIKFKITKLRGAPHWCPIPNDAWAIIKTWNEQPMLPFLHKDGRFWNEERLREEWLAWKRQHSDHIPQDATLHDLRANAVCDRRNAGVPHQQIVAQLGMSHGMVMRYSKHIDQALNAVEGMALMERAENGVLQNIYGSIAKRSA